MSVRIKEVQDQVITVLSHPEADEGLYLRNFLNLHEEDERPAVEAKPEELVEALELLIQDGKVKISIDHDGEQIFSLAPKR